MFNINQNSMYTLRCLIRSHPWNFSFISLFVGITWLAFLLQIAEYPLNRSAYSDWEQSYINTWWLSFVTCTTVGYGDFYPQTSLGRIVGIVISIFGLLLTGLMVNNIIDLTNMNIQESHCFAVLEKCRLRDMIKTESIRVVA